MADRKYIIEYIVDPGAALRGLDAIDAKLAKVDASVDRLAAKLKDLPKALNPAGMSVAASQMATAFDQIGTRARAARDAASSVGQNTSNMNNAANRAATLAANLDKVTASGTAAGAAVGGVGGAGIRGGGGAGGGGGGGMLAGLGASLMRRTVFAGVSAGVGAARDGAQAQKEYFERAAQRYNDFRKELIPLANLAGQTDVTGSVISDQIGFQKATGMTADEAINYREQYQGSIGAGKLRGNISDDTASKLEVQGALFAQRYGLEAGMTGKLTGLLSEYGKIPTAEAGAARLEGIATHLNVYGVDAVRKYLPGMMGLQAQLLDENGGRFTDPEALAARLALTSPRAKSPDVSAHNIRLANRLLRRFERDDVEGAPGYALKQLGITPEDDFETALGKMRPKLLGPNADQYLKQNGFNSDYERAAVINQAKISEQVDRATGRTDPAIRAKLDRQRASAAANNSAFLGTETGRQKLAEANAFATEIRAGQGQSRFERARLEAETRLRQRREIDTPMASVAEGLQTLGNLGMRAGRDDRIESEMYNDLMRRTGVTEDQIAAKFPEFGQIYQSGSAIVRSQFGPEERAQLYGNVSAAFDPQANGQAAAKVAQAGQLLQAAAQQMAQKPAPKAPGPAPGFVAGRP